MPLPSLRTCRRHEQEAEFLSGPSSWILTPGELFGVGGGDGDTKVSLSMPGPRTEGPHAEPWDTAPTFISWGRFLLCGEKGIWGSVGEEAASLELESGQLRALPFLCIHTESPHLNLH